MPRKGYNFDFATERLEMAKGTKGTRGYNLNLYPLQAAFYKGFAILVQFRYRYKWADSGEGTKGTNPYKGLYPCTFSTAASFFVRFLEWFILGFLVAKFAEKYIKYLNQLFTTNSLI